MIGPSRVLILAESHIGRLIIENHIRQNRSDTCGLIIHSNDTGTGDYTPRIARQEHQLTLLNTKMELDMAQEIAEMKKKDRIQHAKSIHGRTERKILPKFAFGKR